MKKWIIFILICAVGGYLGRTLFPQISPLLGLIFLCTILYQAVKIFKPSILYKLKQK